MPKYRCSKATFKPLAQSLSDWQVEHQIYQTLKYGRLVSLATILLHPGRLRSPTHVPFHSFFLSFLTFPSEHTLSILSLLSIYPFTLRLHTHLGAGAMRLFLGFVLLCFVQLSQQSTHYFLDPNSCDIVGDSDLYGIGVRVGFYLQFAAGLFACCFGLSSELHTIRNSTTTLAWAVLIRLFISEGQDNLIYFEYCLTQALVFALNMPWWLPDRLFKPAEDRPSSTASIQAVDYCFWTLLAINGLAMPYFAFTTVHQASRPNCHMKAFLFGNVDYHDKSFIESFKAASIIVCVAGVITLVLTVFCAWSDYKASSKPGPKTTTTTTTDAIEDLLPFSIRTKRFLAWAAVFRLLVALVLGPTSIVFVETMLRFNRVSFGDAPLSTTGQLLPFLIGLSTFGVVLFKSFCLFSHHSEKTATTGPATQDV